jgi:LPPG:FO 2-phospho-L-lactate transferase
MKQPHVVALAGGVGGAKLARGFADTLDADQLTIVVNTGDDFEHLGLHISPDLDTVMYTLADRHNPAQGWGLAGETFHFMQALESIGGESWFLLGDNDLATHAVRTQRLARGASLTDVTAQLCVAYGVKHKVVPMTDDPVRTIVETPLGALAFQDYFVRHKAQPQVQSIDFHGAATARPSAPFQRVMDNIDDTGRHAIVICPSNPYLSIDPILALRGVRGWLSTRTVPAVAVSPIIGGAAIKGPAARIMSERGVEPSALEVARHYRGLIDGLVIDTCDAHLAVKIEALGMSVCVTDIVMREPRDRARLAFEVLSFAGDVARAECRPAR